MKIALLGYGKMGKEIESILVDRSHEAVAKFGSAGIDKEELSKADVAIEFSRPEIAFENIKSCIELNIPVVIGTTGWLDKYEEASSLCLDQNSAMLYSSNFSLGVNLFFEINKKLAVLMQPHRAYKVEMEEIHHTQKLDAPSGTAISLAQQIMDVSERWKSWTLDDNDIGEEIPIVAKRIENIPGTHSIAYNSEIDSIEIKHTAHNRKGFALGAVVAAEFINGKQGIFTMKDVLKI